MNTDISYILFWTLITSIAIFIGMFMLYTIFRLISKAIFKSYFEVKKEQKDKHNKKEAINE